MERALLKWTEGELMKKLTDTIVVVAGGTGSVGEGLVRQFLSQGATVVVPYRSDAKRARLEQYVSDIEGGTLSCIAASVSDEESMSRFRVELLNRHGRVDLGVACLGGWYYGYSLHKMPFEHWQTVIHNNLTTHFLCIRALVSIMHEHNRGVYVMVNGGAAELIAPEEGVVSIVAAAELMMSRVLKQEAHATRIRIHSLMAYHPIKTRGRGSEVLEDWLTPEEVGDYVIKLYTAEAANIDKTIHRLYTRKQPPRYGR